MEEVKGFENFKYNQILELIDEKKKTEVFSRIEAAEIEERILLKEFAKNSKFEDIKVYTIVSSKEAEAENENENENYSVNSIIAKDRTRNFQKFDLNEAVNINKDAFEVASSEMNEEIESIKVSDYSVSTNETKTEMTYEMCDMVKERFNNQVQTIKQLNHHFKKLDIKTEYKEIEPNQVQMRMKYNEEETKKEKEMEILFKKPKDGGGAGMSISDVILASILNSKSAKQYRDELFEKIKAELQKRTSLKVKYKENGKEVSREKFLFGNKNIEIKEPFIREKKDL